LTHWPPAPLRCGAAREALDPAFFAPPPKGCEYDAGTISCFPSDSETPLPRQNSGRRWFFMGNSVTRGYAFALSEMLEGQHDPETRLIQKRKCTQPDNSMWCILNHSIAYYWKNYIGEELAFDDNRDVCFEERANTSACFAKLFATATPRDVLVIGSTLSNTSYFRTLKGDSWTSFHNQGATHARALLHANVRAVLATLTRHFPGPIIWSSYAFLRSYLSDKEFRAFGDPNRYYALLNSAVRCATALEPRVAFLNLAPFQQLHQNTYDDTIHHGKFISNVVARTLAAMLPP
jgi:hypothetical protein